MTRTGMLLSLCTVVATACHSDTVTSAATTDSALQATQCNFGGANDCFTQFNTCTSAENADVQACQDALHACLPPPPQGGMQGGCPGGGHPGGPGGPGGPPPLLADGGLPPPPGGPGGHRPPLDSAAAEACRTALDACIAASPSDPRTCFDTAHQCIEDALRAEFQARCDEAIANCAGSTDEECTRIENRCAQGVETMPVNPDGGVACQ